MEGLMTTMSKFFSVTTSHAALSASVLDAKYHACRRNPHEQEQQIQIILSD
jgi:hypothetical protein